MPAAALQPGELSYQERIDALRETKADHTRIKVEMYGPYDTDDHGYIPWIDPIPFEPVPSHPSGGCWGIAAIGASFKRWLEAYPVYIHPMSSMAGAWVRTPAMRGMGIPGVGRSAVPEPGIPGNWKPEDRVHHLRETFLKYNVYHSGIGSANHLSPDMSIGLKLGWGGLLAKVRSYRELNRPTETSFYDGEEALILGVQHWIRRHVDLAREMAAACGEAGTELNPYMRENLLTIAEVNEWLIDGAPRTLREACQFLVWFQCVDRMWALGGAMGQLDELLLPFYEADLAAGRETDESVVWHLASLFFNDPHYSQIGGQAPDGRDLTSPISFLVLEAMHRLRTPSNITLRVHEGMDRRLLRRAIEYVCEDGTGVAFACSKGLDEGFMRNGHPRGLARMRAKVGCNWTALPGIEYCLQDVTRLCLVTPLMRALEEVVALGPRSRTMDALWERYAAHLGASVDAVKEGKALHMERQADNWPEIVLNLFCHGPVERGLDAAAGGVDIVDLAMDGIGLATVADSFAAIEQRVVREGRLTWEELAQYLADDFGRAEPVRLMLHNVPRYGSGGSRADEWAKRVADLWDHLVRDTPTRNGYTCIPGLFSHGGTNRYGARIGATPNGRHAGEPLSHSADPDPGFLPGGGLAVTAKSTAVASVQPRWGNTTPLQIELDRRLVQGIGGQEAVEALILSHNAQGGTLINMNVLSKQQIVEAHEDPMRHPDLVIRVTGYSAYFRSLSREYRQPIVDRILAEG
jgi:formate C-acetyltransferase